MKRSKAIKEPKKWKSSIFVFTAVYPVILMLQLCFGEWLNSIEPLALRTFVLTLVAVPIIIYGIEPLLKRVFSNWLER